MQQDHVDSIGDDRDGIGPPIAGLVEQHRLGKLRAEP
jgi:hypothetical protein